MTIRKYLRQPACEGISSIPADDSGGTNQGEQPYWLACLARMAHGTICAKQGFQDDLISRESTDAILSTLISKFLERMCIQGWASNVLKISSWDHFLNTDWINFTLLVPSFLDLDLTIQLNPEILLYWNNASKYIWN